MKTLLQDQLRALPARPGVYLLKDAAGTVLYVGKASSLHHRMRSYFSSQHDLTPKLQRMAVQISDFEFFVTESEQEALILECNLIKKYRPRYNVRLKDDKSFPYLKVKLQEDWPGVYITRRLLQDGSRYFGPFASAGSVRKTLSLIRKIFPFRSCNKTITGTDARPCLGYHINHCLGPCIGAVSKEEYAELVRQVILFLEGKQELVLKELRTRMGKAARNLEFERAALLRDQIRSVERVIEGQRIATTIRGEQDVIAFARSADQAYVEVFFIRNGKLIGREHFMLENTQGEAPSQIMTSFVKQFYDSASYIPPLILLQHPVDDAAVIGQWLKDKRGAKVSLQVPRQGGKKQLVDMVAENACQGLDQLRAKQLSAPDVVEAALEELTEELRLPRTPLRIECYDISNIQGTAAVGSMVVFEKGQPKPAHYRRFRIKTVTGCDDYAMMQEMLRRRFQRKDGSLAEGAWVATPDLVLIDGGKGQLHAVAEVLRGLGIDSVPIASIAKRNEEIFLPEVSEPIQLRPSSPALFLVQRIRDEAHRFALAYHQRVRQRESLTSALDGIPGIGPKRKRALLQKFGSTRAIKEASIEEIAVVRGMPQSLAEKVKEYL